MRQSVNKWLHTRICCEFLFLLVHLAFTVCSEWARNKISVVVAFVGQIMKDDRDNKVRQDGTTSRGQAAKLVLHQGSAMYRLKHIRERRLPRPGRNTSGWGRQSKPEGREQTENTHETITQEINYNLTMIIQRWSPCHIFFLDRLYNSAISSDVSFKTNGQQLVHLASPSLQVEQFHFVQWIPS